MAPFHQMLPQENISASTALGANPVGGGATFRLWAPRASAVYLHGTFNGIPFDKLTDDRLLNQDAGGFWTGFQDGARDGSPYKFWVVGPGSSGYKRDPYARELDPKGFPDCNSIVRDPSVYPWHDDGFRTPDFSEVVIYQVHIGTFAIPKPGTSSTFLDVAEQVKYLADLGCNMLQPLPIDEQENNPGMGYEGADLFSPDFPYICTDGAQLAAHLTQINSLLAVKGRSLLKLEHIQSGANQLKVLVDLCHVYGIAVALDVVYNHAGGFSVAGALDDNCLYFLDRLNRGNNNDSLYCTDQDRGTGGLAFALWNDPVSQFLLDNARFYIDEFHADGFRYDEISTLLSTNQGSGWIFCRKLTDQNRRLRPRLLQNAEFWPGRFADIPNTVYPIVQSSGAGGAGFDVVQHDKLRYALRRAVEAASFGTNAGVSMSAIAGALDPPDLDQAWRAVTCIENHDIVKAGRERRIPALGDGNDHRSWYARSRTRTAMSILLTAPGIPQIFVGQEFLEDQPWDENPGGPNVLGWDRLNDPDHIASNHLAFTQDLIRMRRERVALRSDQVHAYYCSDRDRVLAFHRWVEGVGEDVIIIASFAESTFRSYDVGFPFGGFWKEIFNSDVYDHFVNPMVAGNGGGVWANGPGMHGFGASAAVVLPANGVVVFKRG
ncbi:MAG: alpha amylase C-terminal domain-containing protein [Candidatus Solibacter sp.]